MQTIEAPKTVTVDGKEFPVSSFSEVVQRLVAIHTAWRNDLQSERLAVAKTEAAIRSLDAELSQTVGKELKELADRINGAVKEATVVEAPAAVEAANDASEAPKAE